MPDTQSVIAVELHVSLLEVCDKIRLQAELSRTVNELYSQFNIPGSGAIAIDALGADAPQQRPFQLKINGRTAPYSLELLAIVHGSETGSLPPLFTPLEALLLIRRALSALDENGRVRYLAASIVEVCRENLPLFISRQAFERSRDPFDIAYFLSLGMQIPLPDERSELGPSPAAVSEQLESLISANIGSAVDIIASTSELRRLTGYEEPLHEALATLRIKLQEESGVPLPSFRFVPDENLKPPAFRFRINDVITPMFVGLGDDHLLVQGSAARLLAALPAGEAYENKNVSSLLNVLTGLELSSVPAAMETAISEAGYAPLNAVAYVGLCLEACLRRRLHWFLDAKAVDELMRNSGARCPNIVGVLESLLKTYELAPVLRQLVSEQISIRNMQSLCEVLVDAIYSGSEDLVAAIRTGLKREITSTQTAGTSTLVAYLLDERIWADSPQEDDGLLEGYEERLRGAVRAEVAHLPPNIRLPVLLTSNQLRSRTRKALAHEFYRMAVLAHDEIDPNVGVQPVARIAATA